MLLIVCFTLQICFADEETSEDIEQYFQPEPEVTQKLQGYAQYNDSEAQDLEKDTIYLDENVFSKKINFTKPKKISSENSDLNKKRAAFQPFKTNLETASKFSTQEYEINPVSTSYSSKAGRWSFGTNYDSSIDSAQVNYSTAVFTKYDWKYFALKSAFAKSTDSNYSSYNDKFYIAPELKLTKKLSLLEVMQTDVQQINKKNELVLRYTPKFTKYADEVQLELGAGQSFYNDNFIKSSVRFSTNFKL